MGRLLDKVISWTPKVIFLALFTYFISKVIVAVGKLENKEITRHSSLTIFVSNLIHIQYCM